MEINKLNKALSYITPSSLPLRISPMSFVHCDETIFVSKQNDWTDVKFRVFLNVFNTKSRKQTINNIYLLWAMNTLSRSRLWRVRLTLSVFCDCFCNGRESVLEQKWFSNYAVFLRVFYRRYMKV